MVKGFVMAVAVVDGTVAAAGVAERPGRVSELVAAVVAAVAAGSPRDPPRVGSVFAGADSAVAVVVTVLAAGIENPENAGGADVVGAAAVAPNPVNPVVGAAAKGLPNPRDKGAAAGAAAVVNGTTVAAAGAPNPPKLNPPDGVGATAAVGIVEGAGAPNANPDPGEAVTLNAGGAAPATAGVDWTGAPKLKPPGLASRTNHIKILIHKESQ